MIKKIIFTIVLLLAAFSLLFLVDDKEESFEFDYTWTKALCEGNLCRDYLITCKNGEVVEMRPITGFVLFKDLEDNRENKDVFC